jgi:hypothetical protein
MNYRIDYEIPLDDAKKEELESYQAIKELFKIMTEDSPIAREKLLKPSGIYRSTKGICKDGMIGSEILQELKDKNQIPQSAKLASWDVCHGVFG